MVDFVEHGAPNVRGLAPHEVEAGGLVEQLAGVGEEGIGVVGEGGEQALLLAGGVGDGGFAGDADLLWRCP